MMYSNELENSLFSGKVRSENSPDELVIANCMETCQESHDALL